MADRRSASQPVLPKCRPPWLPIQLTLASATLCTPSPCRAV